jgi:hypothetical protein
VRPEAAAYLWRVPPRSQHSRGVLASYWNDRAGGEFGDVDIAVPRVADAGIGVDAAVIGRAAAQRRQHRLEVPVIGARHRLLVVHRRRPDNSLLTLKTTIMMEAIPQEFSASCVQTTCVSPNRVNRA